MIVRIRRSTANEATALTEIALQAKRYWGYPDHWIQHWEPYLTISPQFIINNDVYVAEAEDRLLGFYALVVHETKAELEHLWVAPDRIGQGVGKELFIHAMQLAAGHDLGEVEISADPNAEGFYRRMGASHVGDVTSEIDGQPRVIPRFTMDTSKS